MPKRAAPRVGHQARLDAFLSPRGGAGGRGRAADRGSRFVACPACFADVPATLINEHLDDGRCGEREEATRRRRDGGGGGETAAAAVNVHGQIAHTARGTPWRRSMAASGMDALEDDDARRRGDDDDDDDDVCVSRDGNDDIANDAPGDASSNVKDTLARLMRASAATSTSNTPSLPGHHLLLDFITEDEDNALVAFLDDGERGIHDWKPSTFNGAHRGKAWGVRVDLKRRTVSPPTREMPPRLLAVAEKMRGAHALLARFSPNEANAISYDKRLGDRLLSHVDDRQLSSDVLVNLSLCGECVMTYERTTTRSSGGGTRGSDRVDVRLPRRSLQIQSGDARYAFAHSIANENLLDPRRVSITFRESRTPSTRTTTRGK